jgi:predicted DNA-binding transcriptional regulator AlpA
MRLSGVLTDIGLKPRVVTRPQAAAYCGVSVQTFSDWIKRGLLPGPLPGTARWDLKAIDASLDGIAGNVMESEEDAFDKWKRERDAKKSSGRS